MRAPPPSKARLALNVCQLGAAQRVRPLTPLLGSDDTTRARASGSLGARRRRRRSARRQTKVRVPPPPRMDAQRGVAILRIFDLLSSSPRKTTRWWRRAENKCVVSSAGYPGVHRNKNWRASLSLSFTADADGAERHTLSRLESFVWCAAVLAHCHAHQRISSEDWRNTRSPRSCPRSGGRRGAACR
jgi:hypothetical protein